MATINAFPLVVFIFVGSLAAGSSLIAMLARFDMGTRIIMAMWSMVSWMVWSLQSADLVELSNGEPYYYSLGSLMYLGVGAAFIMLLFVVWGSVRLLGENQTDETSPTGSEF